MEVSRQEVQAAWQRTYATYGQRLSDEAMVTFLNDLARYPNSLVIAGLKAHRLDPESGRYPPTVAHIVEKIQEIKKMIARKSAARPAIAHHLSPEERARAKAKFHTLVADLAQKMGSSQK